IVGGPSLVEQKFDFSALKRKGYVVFLEAKALTPGFLESGVEPDFYLMPFPSKCKDNALQAFVIRGQFAEVNTTPFLKSRWRPVARYLRANFEEYFEQGRVHKGAHKRFKYRPDVYLPDSPFELLQKLPNTRI